MKIIKKLILVIRDLPKTILFNLKVFPFGVACRLPIRVKYNVKLHQIEKNCIELGDVPKPFMVKLGFNGAGFISSNHSSICICNGGKLRFEGKCILGEGFNIHVSNGTLRIGKDFYANRNLEIQCEDKIDIENKCLFGWNVSIRDTDGHKTYHYGNENVEKRSISLASHVWIASECTILKGTSLSKGSIVGCNSLVNGYRMDEENSLLAGIPAKVKKKNITWKE